MKSSSTASMKQDTDFWTYPAQNAFFETALYYGFSLISPSAIEKKDHDTSKALSTDPADIVFIEEKSALLRTYFEKNQPALPLMVASEYPHGEKKPGRTEYTFNIIGTNRSIADATVLKAAYETVKSEGFENLVLEVNSIGDRDSFSRFQRELTQFFRKNINDLDPECRQAFKKDPLALLECSHESCAAFKERMPHPMNYLSEISRAHFMEFLEIIETLDIPYTINHSLVRCPSVASHTIFEITGTHATAKKSEVVVRGCRWGSISKKIGLKKDFLGVSAHVFLPKTAKADVKMKKVHKPVFYFIQIGEEARLKSLNVIEILHKAKIPVYHSLTKDKLTLQLQSAESMKVPYILIMGQKESMDSTVLVRDTNNRSQDTIALKNLAEHLKKML